MSELYAAMSTLRAVRRLKPDVIPEEVLRRVIQAATWAPTGGNRQPYRIVLVQKSALKLALGKLYKVRWDVFAAQYRKAASTLPEEEMAAMERVIDAGDYLANHFSETPALAVFCFNPRYMAITDSKLDRVSVVGGGSVYPAVQNLLLACREEGLGCCLTTLLCECESDVKSLLEIPEEWGTAAVIPMGYPVLGGHGAIKRMNVDEIAFSDQWDKQLFQS